MTVNLEHNETEHVEEWLNFGLERYHPGWRESWGRTITSPELREAIAETPRLAERIQQQILNEIRSSIFADTPGNEVVPFSEVNTVSKFIEKAGNQLCTRVGLAWNANTIKFLLNGNNSHQLVDILGSEAIKSALKYSAAAPAHKTDINIQDLKKVIENDGLVCCLNWIKQFPEYVAVRLAALLPKPSDQLNLAGPANNEMIKIVNQALTP